MVHIFFKNKATDRHWDCYGYDADHYWKQLGDASTTTPWIKDNFGKWEIRWVKQV